MSDRGHDRDRSARITARTARRSKPSMGEIADASEPWSRSHPITAIPSLTPCPPESDDPGAAPPTRPDGSVTAKQTPPVHESSTGRQIVKPPRAADAKSLTVRLHPSTSRLLHHLAIRRSCTIADIVRAAVDEHLISSSLPGIEALDSMSADEIDQLALKARSSPA